MKNKFAFLSFSLALMSVGVSIAALCQNRIPLLQPICIIADTSGPSLIKTSTGLLPFIENLGSGGEFQILGRESGNTALVGGFYGKLEGNVTHDNVGIPNAVVMASMEGHAPYTVTADSNGHYMIDPILGGAYDVTAEAIGFNPYDTTGVLIFPPGTTTLDITITAPDMTVTPAELSVDLIAGEVTDRTLNISNTGDGTLTWSISVFDNAEQVISIPASNGVFPHGNAAPSIGRAPLTSHVVGTREIQLKDRSIGYAFEIYPGMTFFSFNTDTPGTTNTISTFSGYYPSGGTFDATNTDFMYVIDSDENVLIRVDKFFGSSTWIGLCNPCDGQTWTGITVDKTTNIMYGISTDMSESYIYIIDMETLETTVIGATGIPGAIDVTIDGNGQMYSFDIVNDEAYKIDKETGASTLLGSIGYDANYAQGMGWDPEEDIVYLASYNNDGSGGELRVLDRVTGNTNFIGEFPGGNEIDALAFPGRGSAWLSIDPKQGVIPAGNSQDIALYLDATSLEPGAYTKFITFHSEPNVGTDTVPVTFTVFPENGPTLTIPQLWAPFPLASITVHASHITNMGSFQFTIDYDSTKAIYSGISDWYPGITDVTVSNPSAGKLTFVWAASTGGITIDNGNFFTIHLTGTYLPWDILNICWSDNPTPREFADWDGNIFTPFYTDGYVFWFVGVPEDNLLPIHIYPNPASDDVQFRSDCPIRNIEILSFTGQTIYNKNTGNASEIMLSVASWSSGVYLVKIVTQQGVTTSKIVVEH